jgi:hypothetical protein
MGTARRRIPEFCADTYGSINEHKNDCMERTNKYVGCFVFGRGAYHLYVLRCYPAVGEYLDPIGRVWLWIFDTSH